MAVDEEPILLLDSNIHNMIKEGRSKKSSLIEYQVEVVMSSQEISGYVGKKVRCRKTDEPNTVITGTFIGRAPSISVGTDRQPVRNWIIRDGSTEYEIIPSEWKIEEIDHDEELKKFKESWRAAGDAMRDVNSLQNDDDNWLLP